MHTRSLTYPILHKIKNKTNWAALYVYLISLVGSLSIYYVSKATMNSWPTLIFFMSAAIIAEVTGSDLFANSRSRTSTASVIAIAAILVLGPFAGVAVRIASGITTSLVTTFTEQKAPSKEKEKYLSSTQRIAFNVAMLSISSAAGGWVYMIAGGAVGEIGQFFNIPALILAVLVDTSVNILILMGLNRLRTKRSFATMWHQDFRWSAPLAIVSGVIGGGGVAWGYSVSGWSGLLVFLLPVLATGYAFRMYVNDTKVYVDELGRLNQRLDDANVGLLQTLGAIIDAFDAHTFGHSTQVALYANAIAQKMALPSADQVQILRGGLIHDVGKVGINNSIIRKPGRLSDDEFKEIKRHPLIGADIICQTSGLQDLVPLVRNHHERWDGRGYPDGLQGQQISLGARILAVADTVDAMLSDRPYRGAIALSDVVSEVKRCAGAQFDPEVVAAFVAVVHEQGTEFFKNSASYLNNSQPQGIILSSPDDLRNLPRMLAGRLWASATYDMGKTTNIISRPECSAGIAKSR